MSAGFIKILFVCFQKNEKGVFHEVLIDAADSSSPHHFREVLALTPNANSTKLVNVSYDIIFGHISLLIVCRLGNLVSK